MRTAARFLLLGAVLYVFLLSIKVMEGSFKLMGSGFADQLFALTASPFIALFIGILATVLVQSSSLSTSIVVGLVAAGSLPLRLAIPLIFGANIGTTVTNTLASLGHITRPEEFRRAIGAATVHDFFNVLTVLVLFPLELVFHPLERSAEFLMSFLLGSQAFTLTSPLEVILKPVAKAFLNLLAGFPLVSISFSLGLLFAALFLFTRIVKPLVQSEFRHHLNQKVFTSPFRSFLFGVFLTVFVQSSSITTSLVIPLVGVGLLTLKKIYPYTLGANIGTTVTAILASVATGSPAAITIALVHLLFNVFGTAIFYPLRAIPLWLAEQMSRLASQSRIYPVTYVFSAFYVVPSLVVYLFR